MFSTQRFRARQKGYAGISGFPGGSTPGQPRGFVKTALMPVGLGKILSQIPLPPGEIWKTIISNITNGYLQRNL